MFFINIRSIGCCLKKVWQLINSSKLLIPLLNCIYKVSQQDGGLSNKRFSLLDKARIQDKFSIILFARNCDSSFMLENQLNQYLTSLSVKVRKFVYQNIKQSSAIDQLFNFLMAASQDISAIYSNSKRMPICRFIIERVGIDSFKSINTKKFTDLKWLVEEFYRSANPTQLTLMKTFLELAVRFHKPFYPFGFCKFWKEVQQAMKEEKCSEEIKTFLKTVGLHSDLLHQNKQKRSTSMARLYILYIQYSFKQIDDKST